MNKANLKTFAPQARRDFIQAVTDRAALFGLTPKKTEPMKEQGDVVLISGRAYPKSVAEKRKRLEHRIGKDGFQRTMEALAYTWFNRLVAIRFMELHDYLENGEGGASYRVLSHPEGKPTPEILENAEHVELAELNKQKVIDLKLDGTKEEELYRLLLIAQCNALHAAMPFLFERIEDETELLLPDNLLHSDSLVRKLVNDIDEEDWKEVEIIGWLYQFYISERKDEVIGKVVASEDIPAATQLFTPNWIVKYLVQNTLGRQWLATYPQSSLRQQMQYYVEPAEQTPEVQEQLKAITPASLNPEELTLLDPACGSGHILVEAYDLFKAIYQERGYRAKDIPSLILKKNLFGLEIDDRAAQLAAFALMIKARNDDRRIFDSEVQPNVLAFQESKGLDAKEITEALNAPILKEPASDYLLVELEEQENPLYTRKTLAVEGDVAQSDVAILIELFENAKTFGSLIQIPPKLAERLPEIQQRLDVVMKHGDITNAAAHALEPLLRQAVILARQYDAVVANPPYMGSKYFGSTLKTFVADYFHNSRADLYASFVERNLSFAKASAYVGMITIPNWMFLSSFEDLRQSLFRMVTVDSFVHNGRGVFGSDFGSCSFVFRNHHLKMYRACYRRLFGKQGSVCTNDELEHRFHDCQPFLASLADFECIPGQPVAYQLSSRALKAFADNPQLHKVGDFKKGMNTGNNDLFLRLWMEVPFDSICLSPEQRMQARWFPLQKGGPARRWFGNHEVVVDWQDNGAALRAFPNAVLRNQRYYFREGVTWTTLSSARLNMRYNPEGFIFEGKGSAAFFEQGETLLIVLGYCNSVVFGHLFGVISPSIDSESGAVGKAPYVRPSVASVGKVVAEAVRIAHSDWDSCETSWGFTTLFIFQSGCASVSKSLASAEKVFVDRLTRMKELEEENNRLFIDAYGLQDELSPQVSDDQITLYRPDREEDIKRLISYAVGCMMGRYSLDKPGLIYAHTGNQEFDASQYKTFKADDDGIVPLLETDWGIRDDATNRLVEFISVAWPKETLEENLKFIADSLGTNKNEQPRETTRRYLATGFFKHHLSMYKKRPIYWLFSSGKERTFQCLVYLHRYNEGTLARMRNEYVLPLQGKIAARIDQVKADIAKATSTSHSRKLQKEQDKLKKQQAELLAFDDKLKHIADKKIALDLDDGVKVNYGKFGDLLAEVKAICGSKEEE